MEQSDLVDLDAVQRAADRLQTGVRRTPLLDTELGSVRSPLYLKAECLQVGGSFKLRGALNSIRQLSNDDLARGVITHSSGNHAQAVARAASLVGSAATVVMPHNTPAVKRLATEALGAQVVLVDASERAWAVERIRGETGAIFIPPYDHPAVIAGQGTVGLEIVEDLERVGGPGTIYVPVSGGGLISGVAVAAKNLAPGCRVVAVEPELAGDLAESWSRGERTTWDTSRTGRTIADGLRVQVVGELNWRHICALVDDVVTVTEAEIREALRTIVLDTKMVSEPSGAVALAGYFADQDPSRRTPRSGDPDRPDAGTRQAPPGPSVAIVSGGNVDAATLAAILDPAGGSGRK